MTGQDKTVFVDVPTELGPYRLVRLLGRGGMGEVWQAFDTNLERDVAVKLMRRELLANEEAVRRFGREARAVARLNHPNIVQVYAFGDEKGILYFIMELVEGETVGDVIKRQGTIPLEQSTLILLQAIEGLSYASVRGIVHRDIKPSNLMITPDTRVKIADFGLARMMEQDSQVTAAGSTMGSPNYMSPEQARGEEADHRSDIYSLGITYYQMLTGQLPFTAQTPLSVLLMQIQNPLPEPQFLKELADGRALAIIKRMTQKKAADRYQTYAELAADVAKLAPSVRIGHSAYVGTMSMPTPGVVSADLPSQPAGAVSASAAAEPEARAAGVPGAASGSIVTAVGALPAAPPASPSAISESDLGITAPGSLDPVAGSDPGITRTLPPQPSGARRPAHALAFGLGGASVLGAAVLAFYFAGPAAETGAGRESGSGPEGKVSQSVVEAGSVSPAASPVGPPSESVTSAVVTAAATPAASPAPSPVPTEPAPPPAPGMPPPAHPTPAFAPTPVLAGQPPAGQGIAAGTPVYAPTPVLYASNIPVIPSPTPTPRPTPPPVVARYAELAPDQSPNTPVQIYDAQGRPAFELPARTRVEYLEAATIGGRAMVQIGYGGHRGYALLEQINPLYEQAGSEMASPAPDSAPTPALPRQIMAGRPGGTGTIDIFANERLGGRPLRSVAPGTVLDVLDETPQTWVVSLPNGRRGHVLKSLSTRVNPPGP